MQRTIKEILQAKPTQEGAGVRLKRVFGYHQIPGLDPFLLLDHFGSQNPEDYILGFPWHPHRGIETVTYMLTGEVEHGDNLGNKGVIRSGDIQWMTAGSGIIHQEMPQRYNGFLQGFQLWVNLPAKQKMMNPRYRGLIKDDIPTIENQGATIKIIAGTINNVQGPVQDLVVDVEYFDIMIPAGKIFTYGTKKGYTTAIYIIEGKGYVAKHMVESQQCALLTEGNSLTINAQDSLRLLFISGKPIHEPISWRGPIVMNTQKQLDEAFQELELGTFIKKSDPV
jgi:redox-sensitive bicupin YhaK (pirin superfamily)